MLNSFFTFYKIATFIRQRVSGLVLKDIFIDTSHRLFLYTDEGAVIANIGSGKNYIYWQEGFKKKPVPHFPVFKTFSLREQEIKDVFLENNERIISFRTKNNHTIRLFLYPPYNNVVVVGNEKEKDFECYFDNKKEKFATIYKTFFLPADLSDIITLIKKVNRLTLKEALSEILPPMLQKNIREELEHRLGHDISRQIAEMDERSFSLIAEFTEELCGPMVLLTSTDVPYRHFISLLPYIPRAPLPEHIVSELFSDINKTLQIYIHSTQTYREIEKEKDRYLNYLQHRYKYYKNTVKKLREQMRKSVNKEKYIKTAKLIMWNLRSIPPGTKEIFLTDYESPDGEKVKVTLNEKQNPYDFAQKLFAEAHKLEDTGGIEKKIEMAEKYTLVAESLMKELKEVKDKKELSKFIKQLDSLGFDIDDTVYSKSGKATRKIYREYILKHYVFRVGKSASESDELTFKRSKKSDWFFHAQGVTGSHVIVSAVDGKKADYLPKDIIEAAAILAAYYSDAKNSSYVPVQYTQIRYLRKPKGSPAGLVIFNRYKSIFAEPEKYKNLNFEQLHGVK